MTKYNSTDGLTQLLPEDDAATVNWGGDWRMPTTEQINELLQETEYGYSENYENSGINCKILTGPNKNILVLPIGENGTSSWYGCNIVRKDYEDAIAFVFGQNFSSDITSPRYNGKLIRPILAH